ncbi:MAG: RHS repeat-associated core domain-containing protein, partial [Thermoleophilia bacterium]
ANDGLFFLFGSMLYDAATGLYLTKTRAYNPKTGRFLQRDILDESGKKGVYKGFPFGKDAIGTNLYAWCGNNPVTRVDPSGMLFGELGRTVGRFVGGLLGCPDLGADIGGAVGEGLDALINGENDRANGVDNSADYSGIAKFGYAIGHSVHASTPAPKPVPTLRGPSLDTAQMFSGEPMHNLILNCEYYVDQENKTGTNIYVTYGLAEEDWGALWQKEQDWAGEQATITSVTGGLSLIKLGATRSPWVIGGSVLVHSAWFHHTSKTYHPQDVRDYCNNYIPIRPGTFPDPYYPTLTP